MLAHARQLESGYRPVVSSLPKFFKSRASGPHCVRKKSDKPYENWRPLPLQSMEIEKFHNLRGQIAGSVEGGNKRKNDENEQLYVGVQNIPAQIPCPRSICCKATSTNNHCLTTYCQSWRTQRSYSDRRRVLRWTASLSFPSATLKYKALIPKAHRVTLA